MIYLLDTCTFIWLCADPDRLSPDAAQAIDSTRDDLAISQASILEIALKWTAGKLKLPTPPRMWIRKQAEIWAIQQLAQESDDIYRTTELPTIHKDPFDRLLVSTALNQDLTIITPDTWIHQYPVSTLW